MADTIESLRKNPESRRHSVIFNHLADPPPAACFMRKIHKFPCPYRRAGRLSQEWWGNPFGLVDRFLFLVWKWKNSKTFLGDTCDTGYLLCLDPIEKCHISRSFILNLPRCWPLDLRFNGAHFNTLVFYSLPPPSWGEFRGKLLIPSSRLGRADLSNSTKSRPYNSRDDPKLLTTHPLEPIAQSISI